MTRAALVDLFEDAAMASETIWSSVKTVTTEIAPREMAAIAIVTWNGGRAVLPGGP
jgi:hypothetical protein